MVEPSNVCLARVLPIAKNSPLPYVIDRMATIGWGDRRFGTLVPQARCKGMHIRDNVRGCCIVKGHLGVPEAIVKNYGLLGGQELPRENACCQPFNKRDSPRERIV